MTIGDKTTADKTAAEKAAAEKRTVEKKSDEGMPDFSDVQSGASTTAKAPVEMYETYEVKSGDSLSRIAKRVLGDANLWKEIYEANRDTIKDPNLIHPGQKLKIPKKS